MSIQFSKVKETRLWGVTTQNSDTRLTMGDSTGGTFTGRANPLRGTLVWDDCVYVLVDVSVAGGATGGSYTVTIETDAVSGYTGLPIARLTGIGPNSATTLVMDNLHQSPGSPLPTHIFIDQTATGGGINFQCHALAKQYRGMLGTPGAASSERVIQGTMLRGASYAGGPFTSGAGMTVDETFTIDGTSTQISSLGLRNMRLWDRAFYWVQAGNSISGTHNADIIGLVDGTTFVIASTDLGTPATGQLNVANERLPIASNFYGCSPNPARIIWTEVSAGGVSDARIIVLAKSGRGSMAKE